MPDLFRDFTPDEMATFWRSELAASEKKQPKHFQPTGKMLEGYQYLSGEIEDSSKLQYRNYCNELYDAWKGWAPKFCSRPPIFMVRPCNGDNLPLAQTCQELFRYRTQRFDYQQMILQVCQDAVILGIGYFRHHWDESRGLTVTERFKPQNVFWESTATTIRGAKHVIEKHSLPRWQFAKKFGEEVAKDIPASDCEHASEFPPDKKYSGEDNGPLDQIDYYLAWSLHGDHKRCYAFHKEWCEDYLQPASHKANKNLGEEFPFDFDEGEWHLTPLIPTMLNERIEGISAWEVVRGQYIAYQNVMGAVNKYALQTCKKAIVGPDTMWNELKRIEASGETMFTIKLPKETFEDFPGKSIQDIIQVLEFGEVHPSLLQLQATLQQRFQQLFGVTAVSAIQPGNVETAAEATKLADAAANRVADDQGAVERSVNKVARKELTADLAKIPLMPVCEVTDRADEEEESEGDSYGEESEAKGGEQYIRNANYADAILLEKGPANDEAALQMESYREKARNKAWVMGTMGDPQFQGMQPDQAEEAIPVTPEVAVRRKYGIPVLADVKIVNPGIGMFVSEQSAQNWPPRPMTRREVERMFQIGIEQGTSSSNGRMQRVQEIGMVAKTVMPLYQEMGLDKQMAAITNAVVKAAEQSSLDDCVVAPDEISSARQTQQQAMQQQAQAEAQAKQQPQGPPQLDPNVVIKSDAEKHKTDVGLETQREKTTQQRIKFEGDKARERTQNLAQLQMGAMNGANGVY